MPALSVFTPSHRPDYLNECWASLAAQTYSDFEWVVLLSAGAMWQPPRDPRVRVLRADGLTGVGAVKRRACELCDGDILVELDHDDVLASTALESIAAAFDAHPEVGFVYSDWAQINADGSRDDTRFDAASGWEYREVEVDGRALLAARALEPSPHNVSLIWFAPNHVRCFRRADYEAAGGYAPERDVLDDQDLMMRLYQRTEFLRIPECLYLQRLHGANTQLDPTLNVRIQEETWHLYLRDVQANALAWTRRHGLTALDLELPGDTAEGFTRLSRLAGTESDILADLNDGPIPLPDNSVGVIRAIDYLPTVADKITLFNELYRVMAHGAILLTLTPSTDGRHAFIRPDTVAYYNEASFWPFTDRRFALPADRLHCRFQASRVLTTFPSAWHETENLPYVEANLIAVRSRGARQGGHLLI